MSHKKTRKNRSARNFGDVTLNDFANSSVSKSRLKKSTASVTVVLKKLEVEKDWDEKTDEFEGNFVEVEDEDGNISYVIRQPEPRRQKTVSNSENIKCNGNDYPIDIWFLLSEYIRPEDVGRFAAICRTSFDVVCTAKFWFTLYRKYYRSVPNMPEQLQPECLVRKYGLRTSVIRALYYMYVPFVEKLTPLCTTVEEHPDVLLKRQCESLWPRKLTGGHYAFYFKMREKTDNHLQHSSGSSSKRPDILEILDDVSANGDEHCRVLQVTSNHLISVPHVMGHLLTSVVLTLSQGFRHHRMLLGFSLGVRNYCSPDGSDNNTIILDPVINYKILDWWHPLYPHDRSNMQLQHLMNPD